MFILDIRNLDLSFDIEKIENIVLPKEWEKYLLGQECEWFYHERDIGEFSKAYPDLVFILWCNLGGIDHWINYFNNGLIQRVDARICYDDFDKTKLEPTITPIKWFERKEQ